jgi:hypothetical protein
MTPDVLPSKSGRVRKQKNSRCKERVMGSSDRHGVMGRSDRHGVSGEGMPENTAASVY